MEIALLRDAVCNGSDEHVVSKLIEDITHGLDLPHSKQEQIFWKRKIALFLFSATSKDIKFNDQCSISYPFSLSCATFFKLIIKTDLFECFVQLFLSEISEEIAHFIVKMYCHCIVHMHLHDIVVSLAILLNELCSLPNEGLVEKISATTIKALQKLYKHIERCSLLDLKEFHITNLKRAATRFQRCKQLYKTGRSVNISFLRRFQKKLLSKTIELKGVSKETDITKKSDLHNLASNTLQLLKDVSELYGYILNGCVKLKQCSDVGKLEHNKRLICEVRAAIIEVISTQNYFIHRNASQNSNYSGKFYEWNLDSALFCVTHRLARYNYAIAYLLQLLKDINTPLSMCHVCLKHFFENYECMLQSNHIFRLCDITIMWEDLMEKIALGGKDVISVKSSIHCAKLVLQVSYQDIPLTSKMHLMQKIHTDTKMYKKFALIFSIIGPYKDNNLYLRQKINVVFNTLTKMGQKLIPLLHDICSVAFFDYDACLRKIIEQVVYHKEHHKLLSDVLCNLPVFVWSVDREGKNAFVQLLLGKDGVGLTDREAHNSHCFLKLLLSHLHDKLPKIECMLSKCIIDVHILPYMFKCEIEMTDTSLSSACDLLQSIFIENKHRILGLSTCTLFVLVHVLGKNFDTRLEISNDNLCLKLKLMLVRVVEYIKELLTHADFDTLGLCEWLYHASHCFHWTTKFFLHPLLSFNKCYMMLVPVTLKSVCYISQAGPLQFDNSYVKGSGLTAWLQCRVINPDLFPISSLAIQDLNREEHTLFNHGIVLALAQILPSLLNDEWSIIIMTLECLIKEHVLLVSYPTCNMKCLPFVDLPHSPTCLTILEVLHRVIVMLCSNSCTHWMTVSLWSQFTKCYVMNMKNLFLKRSFDANETANVCTYIFVLQQLFFYSCNFLHQLQDFCTNDSSCETVFVFLLDILSAFSVLCDNNDISDESSLLYKDIFYEKKSLIFSSVDVIKNKYMKDALLQKLFNMS